MGLNPRQTRFVQEYLLDLNGTQAAIRAGYSPHTAQVIAAENLKKPMIATAIASAQAVAAQRFNMSLDDLLAEIVRDGELARAQGDMRTALAAHIELAKHLGMNPAKPLIDNRQQIVISSEQIAEMRGLRDALAAERAYLLEQDG